MDNQLTRRELFEREIDSYCQCESRPRPRCAEWVTFSERFLPYCESWNGCWVAEEALFEWHLYLSLSPGQYRPVDYPEGYDFYRGRFRQK